SCCFWTKSAAIRSWALPRDCAAHVYKSVRSQTSAPAARWSTAGASYFRSSAAVPAMRPSQAANEALRLQEGEQVGIDRARFRGGHAVRKALVGLQGPVLQELRRQRPGRAIGNDMIVLAMHHQHRDINLFQGFGEIGLRERDDAVVMRLRTAHHALAPPVLDDGLRGLGARPVVAIERT